jgi:hypothetical protein
MAVAICFLALRPAAAQSPSPSATIEPSIDVLEVLDCDGPPSSTGDGLSPGEEGGGSDDPVESAVAVVEVFGAPRAGYELAALFEHQALVVYRNGGRVKVAVVLRDDLRPFFPAWDVTELRMCHLEEWGPDVELGPERDVWAHADGSIRSSRAGPGHCGWESIRVLRFQRDPRVEYIRDPLHLFAQAVPVPYAEGFALPPDALDTGYRRERDELWVAPDGHAVFVLRDDGVVERWPRLDHEVLCA